ncbi:MAG: LPS export ABC transporter permease LptG [Alphaproteobacteria bacterium]|nr:LPS export ABC transporter permease LptG [Alphaproteobacteria bacterium]MBV9551603.1 LPS export ABC transporter permease LptG [Alphaproteobacteria bacterium]
MLLAKTLSAYIARQFFAWFCGVYGAMLSISFLIEYLELLRRGATRAEVTLGVLLEMAALKLPHTAQEVMPFAVLFGTMLAFWRLTRSNELIVARAAGVSVWQFLTPAMLVALLVGIVAVTGFNPAASQMQATYEQLEARYLKQSADQLSLSNAGLWLRQSEPGGGQVVIHGDKLVAPQLLLGHVSLFFFNSAHGFVSRVEARSARLDDGYWLISDGNRWQTSDQSEPMPELRLPTKFTSRRIEESLASPDTMSFWTLPGFISLLEQSGFTAQRHRLQFNILLARPFLFSAMVLVAATFSLRMQRRGGATLMVVGGVGAGFLLYFISNIVFALGLSAKLPVLMAAWTPTGISLIFGISMLLHLEDG